MMATIELNDEQATTLADILECYISDLRMEIADTDRMDFREVLKEKEYFLQDLVKQLKKDSKIVEG